MSQPEFVDVQVPEDWVTKGQSRPGLVLRSNADGTKDVLVFHHPEDRQVGVTDVQLRVDPKRFAGEESAKPAQGDTRDASGAARKDAPGASPPPEPARGMQAGRTEAHDESPELV